MSFAILELASERCAGCKGSKSNPGGGWSHSPDTSPEVRLRKINKNSKSYELIFEEMESNRTGEVNCKIYSEEREMLQKSNISSDFISSETNGTSTPSPRCRQSSRTPEYVKRTAKLFETVKITEGGETKNGVAEKVTSETYSTEMKKIEKQGVKISLDSLDGEYNKKPSYLGVSCSNSGYRNVINYNSKIREGFWTANSHRESLVLCNSRLRESSPLRRDFDFKSHNGTDKDSVKVTNIRIEREGTVPVNGVSRPEKFVNISTSTKTISTFRNSKNIKNEDLKNNINGFSKTDSESKVNLKQILNGKNDEPSRKGYSNLGFSPKILKSPEKNCNSFLKSISSFENNCKKSQTNRSSTYFRAEEKICDSSNSIQDRIERLYGPGALAQKFYTQKPQTKVKDPSEQFFLESHGVTISTSNHPKPNKSQPSVNGDINANTNSIDLPTVTPLKTLETEKVSDDHAAEESGLGDEKTERNGHYFLKLLKKETDRLESLARFAESELENGENLPEEISGKLRAAAGKARLLVCQKLHQFEGLCHKNLNEKPGEQFPTTSEDLAGFWDMVMLQVVQVYGVFDEIEELKKNNWKPTPTKKESSNASEQSSPAKTNAKKSTPTSSSSEKQSGKSDSAKKAREEARRKLLEERRKKMKELKENKLNGDNEVEIFAK